ncbi:hypothetical protein [Micromonospora sp. CP22]|nr:hypothetical protein [Micromonospora sp. CP22]
MTGGVAGRAARCRTGSRPSGQRTLHGHPARWVARGVTMDDVDERSEEAA